MGANSGGVDWATIGHGMVDAVTPFTIPAGVLPIFTGIAGKAYYLVNRPNLIDVDFEGQTYIPERICQNCGLTTLTLPATISRTGNYCFYGNASLTEVISLNTTPPIIGTGIFTACNALTSIYVPDASVSAYQSASGWSTHASIIKPISQRPT